MNIIQIIYNIPSTKRQRGHPRNSARLLMALIIQAGILCTHLPKHKRRDEKRKKGIGKIENEDGTKRKEAPTS